MKRFRNVTNHNLDDQGFAYLGDAGKSHYALPLRFTPGVSITLIAIGLYLQSPLWLGAIAMVGLSGALFPKGMPIDLLYNLAVRHLFHAPELPPTPNPRRFSYLISTAFLTGSALSFHFDLPMLGLVLGGLICIWGAVLTTTLWCLGSWIYNLLFRSPDVKVKSCSGGLPNSFSSNDSRA